MIARRSPLFRAVRNAALGAAALFVGLVGFVGYLHLTGNFHEVRKGELYRAAQPSTETLERFAKEYGGATVLNLRGPGAGQDWYDNEVAAADRLGLKHIDFRMQASQFFTPETAQQLIGLMKEAPKPLLIHCAGGADRTGFASMVYLMALTDVGEWRAERQLSIRYGHLGIPYISKAYPMDESWEAFERSIGITDS